MHEKRLSFCAALTAVYILLVGAGTAMASGPKERTLYSFSGQSQGGSPYEIDGLVADHSGNLYGTTEYGGINDNGVVFELIPPSAVGGPWTEVVLYSFQSGNDGARPMGGLAFDKAGNLYGTTAYGGSSGYGSVFQLSPPSIAGGPWTETVLYVFRGGADGEMPISGVILDSLGNLYGTTESGGTIGAGTVFELSPPAVQGAAWTETLLLSFDGYGGSHPYGGLLLSPTGDLFGTTIGTLCCYGAVFKLDRPTRGQNNWRESVLYTFSGNNGAGPIGNLALGSDGTLYGVTNEINDYGLGYGTVFQLTPAGPWTETTIYNFTGGNNAAPLNLTFHQGNLYGTTQGYENSGLVFELTLQGGSWVETILHDFAGTDGSWPAARLIFSKGGFYGTTVSGGYYGQGVFFEVMP